MGYLGLLEAPESSRHSRICATSVSNYWQILELGTPANPDCCCAPHNNYFYLDLPKHIVRSVARFCLCVHTLKVEQATWGDTVSPACDLCDAQDNVQDEQQVIFKCTHPHACSLRLNYASLLSDPLFSLSHPSNSMAP
eukprot:1144929-Pelagomonas_calceolata.AAC.5